jgi:hypothetical protein
MPTFLRYAAPTELPPDSDRRSYKDFAPTELVQRHSPAKFMWSFLCVPCDLLRLSQTFVTSVPLL